MKSLSLLLLASFFVLTHARGAGVDSCEAEFRRLIREGDSLKRIENFSRALHKYNSAHTYCRELADTALERIERMFDEIKDQHRTEYIGRVSLQRVFIQTLLKLESIPQISALQDFVQIDLSDSILKAELPPALLRQLGSLKTLNVSQNPELKKLTSSIAGLKNLERLIIKQTAISELPADIGELQNLRELDIRRTNIRTLPASISKLRKLERLYMDPGQLLPAERAKISAPFELVTRPD